MFGKKRNKKLPESINLESAIAAAIHQSIIGDEWANYEVKIQFHGRKILLGWEICDINAETKKLGPYVNPAKIDNLD